jgi:hypothetical protein
MANKERTRKAWQATVSGYGTTITDYIYAPTRGKAVSELYYRLSDAWNMKFKDVLKYARVVRAEWRDQVLPERHPLAPHLSSDILHCVEHAYGGTGLKAGYRDHFYTSDSDPVMKAAYYHGLFDRYRVDKRMAGSSNMVMYELTLLGKNVARGEAEVYPRGY